MIATIISIHKSTVSHELQRNPDLRGYRLKQAHVKAMQRRHKKPRTYIPKTTCVMVDSLIKQDWSLEQISDRLYEEQGISTSHEWIYLYIYKDKRQGGFDQIKYQTL
jgi:transposase, IS30 family